MQGSRKNGQKLALNRVSGRSVTLGMPEVALQHQGHSSAQKKKAFATMWGPSSPCHGPCARDRDC